MRLETMSKQIFQVWFCTGINLFYNMLVWEVFDISFRISIVLRVYSDSSELTLLLFFANDIPDRSVVKTSILRDNNVLSSKPEWLECTVLQS